MELAFSQVFGGMIEDAVNVMNDAGMNFGELDRITEISGETESISNNIRSTLFSNKARKEMETALMKSIMDNIPDEIPDELSSVSEYVDDPYH